MGSITLSKHQPKQPCDCGCAECQGNCCQLDCLERPRFYCGQLLTDQDLTALVRWTQDKFRLNRYRDGWGVVCGLDVYCDHKNEGHVIVGPGYAIGCCGDDILVCKEDSLDLRGACREDKDPCADPRNPVQKNSTEIRAVDIYVRYKEEDTRPKNSLKRDNCGQVGSCENSRTKEAYHLDWKRVLEGSDPTSGVKTEWENQLKDCKKFLNGSIFSSSNVDDIKKFLLEHLAEHPLHHFCEVHDWICELPTRKDWQQRLIEILFYIVIECRNKFLNCECSTCESDKGVLLARVHLKPSVDANGHRHCQVLRIDPYPPYRRMLSRECWPAPLGKINLGRFIWHSWAEVCLELGRLGIRVQKKDYQLSEQPGKGQPTVTTNEGLAELLSEEWFASCADDVVAKVVDDRIVGFSISKRFGDGPFNPIPKGPAPSSTAPLREPDDFKLLPHIDEAKEEKLRRKKISTFAMFVKLTNKNLKEIVGLDASKAREAKKKAQELIEKGR